MNRYTLLGMLSLLCATGSLVANDASGVEAQQGADLNKEVPAPVSFSNMTDMLRNMTPEQQKDFDEYLRTVEDMYAARVPMDQGLPYESLVGDGKLHSSTKKDDKETEGFFVESSEKLSSFKDLVGGVPDGIMLTVKALNKKRFTKIDDTDNSEEGAKRRKNTNGRLLLYGPPGTGKTTLAAAFAHEIGASFIRVKGTSFIDGYIATGTDRIHKLFEKARGLNAPVVVFIDEVDAIGRERTKERNDEYANTLVALIQELDACEREAGGRVFVVLATNMFGTLDQALRSRFSNTAIEIKAPTSDLGQQIMEYYLNDYDHEPLSRTTKWWIKFWTRGFSGRDYENMINKAYIFANEGKIKKEHLLKAMNEAAAARSAGEKEKDSWIKKIAEKYSSPWSSTMSAVSYTSAAWFAVYGLYNYIEGKLNPKPFFDPHTAQLVAGMTAALVQDRAEMAKQFATLAQQNQALLGAIAAGKDSSLWQKIFGK